MFSPAVGTSYGQGCNIDVMPECGLSLVSSIEHYLKFKA